ncbi:MAG: efflux RND transporter periplasmic adaptor subunit [Thioalkalispiraceae bacterium]|jgi:membrane fusion protein (multidrug efflux system)
MRHITFFLIVIFIISACDSDLQTTRKKGAKSHPVEVVIVQREPLTTTRIVTGTLEATRTVHVFNEEQGRIKQIPYHPGDRVKQGDLLVALDDSIIQAELDKAIATYKQAVLNQKRLTKLKPRNLASEDEIARAETAVEQARAEKVLQETRLAHTRIKAPFDGLISERLKEPGDVVSLHDHILTIYDPNTLIAKIHVSEILLHNIELEDSVALRVDALGDQQFKGIVTRKYPVINPATRQGTLEVTLSPVPEGAYPGQLARITIEGETIPLKSLPLSVVRHDTRGEFVYRVNKDNKAIYTTIQTGIQIGDRIEIIKGLEIGDKVISKGFLNLRNKATVKIALPTKQVQQTPQPVDNKTQ